MVGGHFFEVESLKHLSAVTFILVFLLFCQNLDVKIHVQLCHCQDASAVCVVLVT